MKRVLKWSVSVDDRDHPIGGGPVVLVGCQAGVADVVHVWTEEDADKGTFSASEMRRARVYGTAHPIPDDDEHIGSVIAPVPPPRTLVWHVYGSRA